jgi:5-methylcytosine-specific restriction endonuclease McrA
MKACSQCGIVQVLSEFGKDSRHTDGHTSHCLACERARSIRRNLADPEAHRARTAKWAKDNPEHHLDRTHRVKAKKANAEGTHTWEEFEIVKEKQNHQCAMCGRHESERPLTRDHIIPLCKGGSNFISNIQGLCKQCNSSKGCK